MDQRPDTFTASSSYRTRGRTASKRLWFVHSDTGGHIKRRVKRQCAGDHNDGWRQLTFDFREPGNANKPV